MTDHYCHSASQALDVQKTRRITTESQQCYLQLLLLIITRMQTVLYIESVQMCREMIHESESMIDTIIDY